MHARESREPSSDVIQTFDHAPALTHPYFALGQIHLSLNPTKWDEALRLMKLALTHVRNEKTRAAWTTVTTNQIANRVQDPRAAKQLHLELLASKTIGSPGYSTTCCIIATACYRMAEFQEAVSWYEKAAPAFEVTGFWAGAQRAGYGDALWRVGRHNDATQVWRQALEVITGEAHRDPGFEQKLRSRLDAAERGEQPPLISPTAPPDTHPVELCALTL